MAFSDDGWGSPVETEINTFDDGPMNNVSQPLKVLDVQQETPILHAHNPAQYQVFPTTVHMQTSPSVPQTSAVPSPVQKAEVIQLQPQNQMITERVEVSPTPIMCSSGSCIGSSVSRPVVDKVAPVESNLPFEDPTLFLQSRIALALGSFGQELQNICVDFHALPQFKKRGND